MSSDLFDALSSGAVRDHDELRSIYGEPHAAVIDKVTDRVDAQTAAYVAATSLVFLSSHSPDGRCDVTPRGGEPGFVKVLDERSWRSPTSRATDVSTPCTTSWPRADSVRCS